MEQLQIIILAYIKGPGDEATTLVIILYYYSRGMIVHVCTIQEIIMCR